MSSPRADNDVDMMFPQEHVAQPVVEQAVGDPASQAEEASACVSVQQILEAIVVQDAGGSSPLEHELG